MKLVNIGCGNVYHTDWINLDKVPRSSGVKSYDITHPLPFTNCSIGVCYSSHVLEHLPPEKAQSFIQDCWRVLKPQGILRVVVPDLEGIVTSYLTCLEKANAQEQRTIANYDWSILELLDQITRSYPGGKMAAFLQNPALMNQDFIRDRLGQEAEMFWQPPEPPLSLREKLRLKGFAWLLQKSRYTLAEILVTIIAGKSAKLALQEGLFRRSGEIHQWMYDRFSLTRLLESNGFAEIQQCTATQSQIPNFNHYQLDTEQGQVRKPDSLFMEARKNANFFR